MLCPVCATEMNNSPKCPFCGHVCSPDEDNTVMLNGEVISTGHRNRWCRTTDDPHLAGKVVNGTHYHEQNPYKTDSYAAGQPAAGAKMPEPNAAGQFGQNIEIQSDLMPYNPNQGVPGQEISYNYNSWTGMQIQVPGDEAHQQKANKKARWVLIIFILAFWGLPFLFSFIGIIISLIINLFAG